MQKLSTTKRRMSVVLIISLIVMLTFMSGCATETVSVETNDNDIVAEVNRVEALKTAIQVQKEKRLAAEKQIEEETERIAAEQAERKAEAEKLIAERLEKEEAERLAAEQAAQEEAERLAAEQAALEEAESQSYGWDGQVLTAWAGVVQGPSGKETYYNLPMQGVIDIMRGIGNYDEYWVRSDGVKMLGDYVMIAADLSIRPRGSLVETSLGTGIVCDTGTFIYSDPYQIDIAVTW